MNAAKEAEAEAKLQADRAQANQEIVTETKVEIDEIYADIQTKHEDIVIKNDNVNEKAEQVNEQAQQVEDWYNNFKTGCTFIEFTEETTSTVVGEDGSQTTISGWDYDESTKMYTRSFGTNGVALLSIQMLNEAGQYVITMFADAIVGETDITLVSFVPFAGRLQLHTLLNLVDVENNKNEVEEL